MIVDRQGLSDFEFQLQAERLQAAERREGAWNKEQTYTEPSDGTVYVWVRFGEKGMVLEGEF